MKIQKEAAFPAPKNSFEIWNRLGTVFPYEGLRTQSAISTMKQATQPTEAVSTPWETSGDQATKPQEHTL